MGGHGTAVPTQAIESGNKVVKPEDPAEEGWAFKGWYAEDTLNTEFDYNTGIIGPTVIYAKWIETFPVSFNANGHGTAPASQAVESGANAAEPETPSAEGYDFGGWYKEAACTNAWKFDTDTVTEATELYAKWTIKTYTVSFNANGHGTAPGNQTVEHGSKATAPDDLSAEGYDFGGWYKEAACTNAWKFDTDMVTEATELYAKWTIKTYTVSFNADGGTPAPESKTVEYNQTVAKPDDPTKEHYEFKGWTLNGADYAFTTPVTGDITLTAKWQPVNYTVTYMSNGSVFTTQTVAYGSNATAPTNPSYTGHVFSAWMLGEDIYGFNTPISGDLTLTAAWDKEPYAVTFNSNGGSAVEPQTVAYGDTASAPADPSYDGHIFKGWTLNGTAYDFSQPVTGAVNLKAEWETIYYAVTFDTDGGVPVPETQTVAAGAKAVKPATDPEKEGYDFAGWYQSDKTTALDFSAYVISEDVTICALWTEKPVTYTVSFSANGHGTAPEAQTVESGAKATKPADLSAEGWTFGGWYADAACTTAFDFDTAISADTTVYAKWTENEPEIMTYTVTFEANGHGTAPEAQTVESGAKATKPADLSAEGWTFGGWYADAACTTAFDFDAAITADVTVYAKWTENEPETVTYTVTFNANGHGTAPESQTVESGAKATKPTDLSAEGWTFGGWYADAACTTAFDFDAAITADVTVYAKWTEVSGGGVTPYVPVEETVVAPVTEDTTETETETETPDVTEPVVEESSVTVSAETTEDGEAKAEVSEDAITEALENSEEEVLTVKVDTEDAESVELTLSAEAVQAAADGDVDLYVETEQGTVKLDSATLGELAESGAEIAVTVTANEDGSMKLDVTADGETVDAKIKVELPAAEEGQVLVLVKEDGSEEVIKKSAVEGNTAYLEIPAGATVKAVDTKPTDYTDVPEDAWYADSVDFVSSRSIFQGTGDGFEPETPMNRAMLATVLYRLEDASATGENVFPDVSEDAWYADAVNWAAEEGIVNGTDKGFEPMEIVTREQIATMFYRYAITLGLDVSGRSELSAFTDGSNTSVWAKDAMEWAVSVGLFGGDDQGSLDPQGEASRAVVATLVERMIKLIVK